MTVINTNVKALFAQNSLSVNGRNLTNAMQQLSTGSRINSAKDDAAGLAIGTRMTADLRGMSVAMRNANDGISMMQTAEGALGEISNMLQRMRDLSAQSATGSLTSSNRQALQAEVDQLVAEIDNIAKATNFNGIKLLDGSSKSVALQTGVMEGDQVTMGIEAASSKSLGLQGFRVEGQVTSGRVGSVSGLAVDDVQINAKNAFATAPAANTALALADAINSNAGQHRVTAEAFNTFKGSAPTASVFAAGAVTINSDSVGAASSVEELVQNINRDVAGITAVLGSDGTIELSNDTGADIVIAGTAPTTAGLTAATYTGFVTLSSMDGGPVSVKAKNLANGYTGGQGTIADVKAMGLNETTDGSQFAGSAVSTTATGKILTTDDLRINGIQVGPSSDTSATSKAAAINAVSAQSGVTATARTEVALTLDVTGTKMTDLDATAANKTFSINGKTVDLSSAISLATAVDEINLAAVPDVLASSDDLGRLILTSSTGANITVVDGSAAFVTGMASTSGEDAVKASDGTAHGGFAAAIDDGLTVAGRISLNSETGADIRVESKIAGSATKIGFADQGGSDTMVGGALTVTTQAAAGRAITAIDAALDEVSMSRSTLGAFQNRLTAAVDNLASGSANLAEARGRIMDTDYAKATTELARTQIVQQAATAMLAQANQQPQMVLSLLQ
jgi:flagellin